MPLATDGVTVTDTEPAWPHVMSAAVPDTDADALTTVTCTDPCDGWVLPSPG